MASQDDVQLTQSLLSLVPVVGGALGSLVPYFMSEDTSAEMKKLKMQRPAESYKQEALAKELSYMGLPGYEKYKEEISQVTPNTVSQARKVAQSPSQLIDLMSRSQTATNEALQNLQIRDTQQNVANKQNYQNVLGQLANENLGIQRENLTTDMSALQQEAQGEKDLFQGLTNALGSGINTYGMLSQLGYQKDLLKGYQESWGGMKTNPLTPTAPTTAPFESGLTPMQDQMSKIFGSPTPTLGGAQPNYSPMGGGTMQPWEFELYKKSMGL